MKIFIPEINESWIVDRFRQEFYKYNDDITSSDIINSDIIWILAPWVWKNIPKKYLKKKKVICTIHHFENKDFEKKGLKNFYSLDQFVDEYHVISKLPFNQIKTLTTKKVTRIPFWVNQNLWFEINDKLSIRKKYSIEFNDFVIGSFQRDTEGKDLISPKLIKGPDRFVEIVKKFQYKDPLILLTGKRRQYLIKQLENLNIRFKYFEMVELKELNELYNCLNLYIVSSRIEGGPQSILECASNKTPIISTNVGIASEILSKNSIFNMKNFQKAIPDVNIAFHNVAPLRIPIGFEKFIDMFNLIYNEERFEK